MPVILEDDMLIPPSLRRKRYIESDRSINVSNGSVIDLPPHEPRIEYTGNSEPVIIHQDHYINQRPTEIIREREIIMDPSLGSNVGRRYRVDELDVVQYSRRGRARSVGYDGYTDSSSYGDETDVYYLEDGSRHTRPRRGHGGGGLLAGVGALAAGRHHRHHSPQRVYAHDGHQNHHNGRHLAEGALGGALVRGLRRSSSPSSDSSDSSDGRGSHHHRLRHVAETGIAAAGAKALYDHHRAHRDSRVYHHEDHDPHRHARHLAEAGLGIAAAGAAKELYDHRRRTRSRSSSSSRSRSRSRSRSHAGRHVAAAALGATAAGLAAHKFRHRRDSYSSYSSDDGEHHHRGRKVAAGVAGATAAGLAAKHFHDRRHRSRSSSTSSTSSTSSNRSSHNRSSHKLRNAALGIGAATLAAHHHHKKEQERRSRSQSRPGILRHRSRSYSAPRHRSPSHGPGLAKVAAATMAGALAERQYKKHRARSADAGGRRRHQHQLGEKRVHYHNNPRAYERSIHPDSSVSNRPRSRRGSMSGGVGSMIKNAIMPSSDHHSQNGIRQRSRSRSRGSGLAQNVAYRIGEGMAEEMAYRVGEETVGGLRRHSRHR